MARTTSNLAWAKKGELDVAKWELSGSEGKKVQTKLIGRALEGKAPTYYAFFGCDSVHNLSQ